MSVKAVRGTGVMAAGDELSEVVLVVTCPMVVRDAFASMNETLGEVPGATTMSSFSVLSKPASLTATV